MGETSPQTFRYNAWITRAIRPDKVPLAGPDGSQFTVTDSND